MNGTSGGEGDSHADIDAIDRRVRRLERRVQRERDAREQAERIAERGMRDLWQTNRTLEARVAERTVDLERSLASAAMAAEAKERFLGELGHELNTPLHAVLGLLELIDASVLEPADRGRLAEARTHALTLSELLGALVELAGAEGAPRSADFEKQTASEWLDSLIDEWTRPAALRGQLLVPTVDDGDRRVSLDWRRLTKIASALLSNAVHHGSPGGVEVRVTVTDQAVELTVVDAGPGMSSEELSTALEPFVTHRASTGIGIGLTVAQRLALAADGALEIEIVNGGTEAAVSLPHRS